MSLEGLRVAVTRASEQAQELCSLLEAERARVLAFSLIRLEPADDAGPLIAALRDGHYHWVIFTSANAVRFCAAALDAAFPERHTPLAQALGAARIACVGPATARAAEAAGLRVVRVADRYTGEALGATLRDVRGLRVLWPRAEAAAPTVREALEAAGAHVTTPVAYRSVAEPDAARALAATVLQGGVDVVTFMSPSSVRSLAAVMPTLDAAVRVAAIGPVTAEAARAAGYRVDIEAEDHSAAGLVMALLAER